LHNNANTAAYTVTAARHVGYLIRLHPFTSQTG